MVTILLIKAILSFLATNVDDVVLLMILAAQVQDNRVKRHHIWIGQFLAIGLIVGLSLAGALAASMLPDAVTANLHWLGFLPIALGIWHFTDIRRGSKHRRRQRVREKLSAAPRQDEDKEGKVSVSKVFAMLFTAGIDNVGVYIPLFAMMARAEMAVSTIIFMGLTWVLCFVALRLARIPALEKPIQKYEMILVPLVLIIIGITMLIDV